VTVFHQNSEKLSSGCCRSAIAQYAIGMTVNAAIAKEMELNYR
jgi:hypothetical protein